MHDIFLVISSGLVSVFITRVWIHFANTRYKWECPYGDCKVQSKYQSNIDLIKNLHLDQYPEHEHSQ